MAKPVPWLVPAVWVGGLAPLGWLLLQAALGSLGSEPVSEVLNQLGLLALATLLLSLACTPLKTLSGWTWPVRVRRALGLIAFAYALTHFLTYSVLSKGLNWKVIWTDVSKRPFTIMGAAALLLLTPLAVTSTQAMVKRLGFVRWKRLHRLVYLAGIFAVIHYVWRVKKDRTEPYIYGAVLGFLLVIRVIEALKNRSRRLPRGA